jgi:hypothetical protein
MFSIVYLAYLSESIQIKKDVYVFSDAEMWQCI